MTSHKQNHQDITTKDITMNYKLYVCMQCGFEYDEEKGWPEDGIAPGTRWDDIPDDWSCPDCGAAKADFYMEEVTRS